MAIPVRIWIIVMIFFTTYINYTTRSNMSMSLPAMVKLLDKGKVVNVPHCRKGDPTFNPNKTQDDTGVRFHWSQHTQGLVLGAYFYGYTPGSLPAGIISEWWGPFWTIFVATAVSAVLNELCVWGTHLHVGFLFACRFIIGFMGGLVYPALQCLIGRWAPPQERGKFVSGLMGNTLGTCLTWIIVGGVTKAWGWEWGFHVLSIQIVIFLAVFWVFVSDSPELHTWITDEELKYIKDSQAGAVTKTKAMPPYKQIFTSFPFWTLCLLHFGNLWGLYVQIAVVPKFIAEVIGFNIRDSGLVSSLPHLVRLFLGLGYGVLGDYLKRTRFSREVVLKSFVTCSHIIPGILMACMGLVKCNYYGAIALLVLSMSINGAVVLTNLSNPTDLSPNFAGTIFGIISFIGGTTGFIVPQIMGALTAAYGNNFTAWGWVFAIGGIVYCSCGIFFIIFGTSKIQPWNEKKDDPEGAQTTSAG
ncbi:sialin-like [Cylas formicarius]|uniref:sialin-like n=1 Tax=Cylas formicarius TaxID=197179 RepID=UPI002958A3E9|nr:sialin-like [Cylas formicarius]